MKLPASLPDELLLSRLIRYVTVSGENGNSFTYRVFGSRKISLHPFLTAGIGKLAAATHEDPEVIFFKETLAPLFQFFLPSRASSLMRFMHAADGARALRESQLPSFASGRSLCLKSCSICARLDLGHHGVAYWHRIHQVPGVTACAIHAVLLDRVELPGRQRIIAGLLPNFSDQSQSAVFVECRVARFAAELLHRTSGGIIKLDVASVYRSRLRELGFTAASGRVRRKSLMEEFNAGVRNYRAGPDTPLPRHIHDYRYLSQLLEPGTSHHPFRHILIASWMFHDAEHMIQASKHSTDGSVQCSLKQKKPVEQQCIHLLRQQHSLEEISRITGKSRCYLKRIGSLNGIVLKTKPRKLLEECKKRILRLAKAGMHRQAIASLCGIGVGSVEQTISSHPGLVQHRKLRHLESKRRRCRCEILRFIRHYPESLRRDIKAQCSSAFFWLYHYDADWLNSILPKPAKPCGRYGRKYSNER